MIRVRNTAEDTSLWSAFSAVTPMARGTAKAEFWTDDRAAAAVLVVNE